MINLNTNPLSLFDISNKSALIIGAAGTFGRAASKALAAAGCDLTIADKNIEDLEKLSNDLELQKSNPTIVDKWPDTEANAKLIIEEAASASNSLDLMFIALGTNDVGYIEDQKFEDWRKVMMANLDLYWLACQAAGRQFAKQKKTDTRNKVVVVSSTRGRHGLPNGYTGYCASKSGLDGMVKALACEWGAKNSNINAIGPTVFKSPLAEWMFSDEEPGKSTRDKMLERVPLGRLSHTDDLIGGLIYLLSPASEYVTGQTLYIDGGYTAE